MRCVPCQRSQETVVHTLTLPCSTCGVGVCMYHTCSLALAKQQCEHCFGYDEDEEEWRSDDDDDDDGEGESWREGTTMDRVCTEMYLCPDPKPRPVHVSETSASGNMCSICLELIGNREGVSPMCGSNKHIFHDTCLSNWWERSPTCPLCRG